MIETAHPAESIGDPPILLGEASGTIACGALFVAVFLFFWISVNPFIDLTDPTSQTPTDAAGVLNQVVAFGLAAASGLALALGGWRHCRHLAVPLYLAALAWLCFAAAASVDPALSARRFVLTLLIIAMAVNGLLMPRSKRQFGGFLALGLLGVLVVSYGGVVLWPSHAIHSAAEILEPMHAGHWRGPFVHKNAAGGAMALAVIAAIFVARTYGLIAGASLGIGAGLFLIATVSKTSIALLPASLILSEALLRMRRPILRRATLIGVLATFGLLTVGSVVIPAVHAVLEAVSSDPTYTNRTEIWTYGLSRLGERAWLGHGFEAFWRSESVFYADTETFASQAANAHDGYLDILLTTGIPGLLLCLGAFVVQPLMDLDRSLAGGGDPTMTALFTRLWVFCLLQSFLESTFFTNTPGWFMFLIAVLGLRFQAAARTAPCPARGADVRWRGEPVR